MTLMIDRQVIDAENAARAEALTQDYKSLGERLARRGVDIDAVKAKVAAYGVAVPSWGVGTGGTRFARFPGKGEPRNIFDKIEDCSVIQQLTRATPTGWRCCGPRTANMMSAALASPGGAPRSPHLTRSAARHGPWLIGSPSWSAP